MIVQGDFSKLFSKKLRDDFIAAYRTMKSKEDNNVITKWITTKYFETHIKFKFNWAILDRNYDRDTLYVKWWDKEVEVEKCKYYGIKPGEVAFDYDRELKREMDEFNATYPFLPARKPIPIKEEEMGMHPINLIQKEETKMPRSNLFQYTVILRPRPVRDATGNDATPQDTLLVGPDYIFVPTEEQARIIAATKVPADYLINGRLDEIEVRVQQVFR